MQRNVQLLFTSYYYHFPVYVNSIIFYYFDFFILLIYIC